MPSQRDTQWSGAGTHRLCCNGGALTWLRPGACIGDDPDGTAAPESMQYLFDAVPLTLHSDVGTVAANAHNVNMRYEAAQVRPCGVHWQNQ